MRGKNKQQEIEKMHNIVDKKNLHQSWFREDTFGKEMLAKYVQNYFQNIYNNKDNSFDLATLLLYLTPLKTSNKKELRNFGKKLLEKIVIQTGDLKTKLKKIENQELKVTWENKEPTNISAKKLLRRIENGLSLWSIKKIEGPYMEIMITKENSMTKLYDVYYFWKENIKSELWTKEEIITYQAVKLWDLFSWKEPGLRN